MKALLKAAEDNYQINLKIAKGDKDSEFLLESLHMKVQSLHMAHDMSKGSQTEEEALLKQMSEILEQMDMICMVKLTTMNGVPFVWRS